METITHKQKYVSGILKNVMVRALGVQKRNVHLIENNFADLMDFIVVPFGIVHSKNRIRPKVTLTISVI
jgi:hypothetical protein